MKCLLAIFLIITPIRAMPIMLFVRASLLIPLFAVTLLSCGNSEQISPPSVGVLERNPFSRANDEGPFAYQTLTAETMGKWTRSCALCHINGEAGAPVIGDGNEWRERISQGYRTVMRHVLQGYNQMPPLGYCMACDEDDFRAMTAFMAGEFK